MKYYFIAVYNGLIRTFFTWYLYPPIILFVVFKIYPAIPFYFLFILGTKLYRYIDLNLHDSEKTLLGHQLRDSKVGYKMMLYTQTICIWGGLIMTVVEIGTTVFSKDKGEEHWTEKGKQSFLESCNGESAILGLTEEESTDYCSCVLIQLMEVFPDPSAIEDGVPNDIVKEIGMDCLQELELLEKLIENNVESVSP